MQHPDSPPNIAPLVRQYSLKAHEETPDDPLTHTIVSVVRQDDAKKIDNEQETVSWKKWIEFGTSE